jgi:hypothetical protein
MQTLRRRRRRGGLEGQQVGDCGARSRKFEGRSIDNLLRKRTASRHTDRLRAVVDLVATGASRAARLSAAEILGARQFVGRVIDHFIRA